MSPQILPRVGADTPLAANTATPRNLSPEAVAGARAVIGDLLATLGIRWRHLVLIPCTEGWCLTLQCRVAGRFRALLLELSADAVQAAEQGGARRRALAVELDEYLAECERRPRAQRAAGRRSMRPETRGAPQITSPGTR